MGDSAGCRKTTLSCISKALQWLYLYVHGQNSSFWNIWINAFTSVSRQRYSLYYPLANLYFICDAPLVLGQRCQMLFSMRNGFIPVMILASPLRLWRRDLVPVLSQIKSRIPTWKYRCHSLCNMEMSCRWPCGCVMNEHKNNSYYDHMQF